MDTPRLRQCAHYPGPTEAGSQKHPKHLSGDNWGRYQLLDMLLWAKQWPAHSSLQVKPQSKEGQGLDKRIEALLVHLQDISGIPAAAMKRLKLSEYKGTAQATQVGNDGHLDSTAIRNYHNAQVLTEIASVAAVRSRTVVRTPNLAEPDLGSVQGSAILPNRTASPVRGSANGCNPLDRFEPVRTSEPLVPSLGNLSLYNHLRMVLVAYVIILKRKFVM